MKNITDDHVGVIGYGMICQDILVETEDFPLENQKIRGTSCRRLFGGNCYNVMTNLQNLENKNLDCFIISFLGNDSIQKECLEELRKSNINSSGIVSIENSSSPFSFIILNQKTKSRTCILTPLVMKNSFCEYDFSKMFEKENIKICFFDHRYPQIFRKSILPFVQKNKIPIFFNYERRREDDINQELLVLRNTKYLIGNGRLPNIWIDNRFEKTENEENLILQQMSYYLSRFPNIEFIAVTQGERGTLFMKRNEEDNDSLVKPIDWFFKFSDTESLKDGEIVTFLHDGKYIVKFARAYRLGLKLVDTTGAGDAFSDGMLFSIINNFEFDQMLRFSNYCGAKNCEGFGTTNLKCTDFRDFQRT